MPTEDFDCPPDWLDQDYWDNWIINACIRVFCFGTIMIAGYFSIYY
jgi:hypothetical protein